MTESESPVTDATRYLKTLAASTLLMLTAVAALNLAIDPKGLYSLVRIDGFNSYKVFQGLYIREYKALAIRRFRPDTILFGASPVTRGIVPRCLGSEISSVSRIYNYGGLGDRADALITDLDDLIAMGSIRRIVLEARFLNHYFLLNGKRVWSIHHQTLLPPADGLLQTWLNPWIPAKYAGTYIKDLFSWNDLLLSARTVLQNRQTDRSFLSRGFNPDGSLDQQWLQHFSNRVITEQQVTAFASSYSSAYLPHVSNDMDIDYSYVRQLAEVSRRTGIAIDIFILPEHVTEFLFYHEAGIWPLYEKFKLNLLDAVESARKQEGANIRLFDFGNINDATTQPIRQNDASTLYDLYFEDPVHFRPLVGDFLLSTVLECKISAPVPVDFGLQLNRENAQQHVATEFKKLEAYRLAHPQMVQKISEAIGSLRKGLAEPIR